MPQPLTLTGSNQNTPWDLYILYVYIKRTVFQFFFYSKYLLPKLVIYTYFTKTMFSFRLSLTSHVKKNPVLVLASHCRFKLRGVNTLQSQAPLCASYRKVKLCGVHHTAESNCTPRSQNRNVWESLVAFKGTIRRIPFRG